MDAKNQILNFESLRSKLNKKEFIYLDSIKNTLRLLKLSNKGKKKELIQQLLSYYNNEHYTQNIKHILFIQRKIKIKIKTKNKNIHKNIKRDYINTEDFFTLEPIGSIEKDYLFEYTDENNFVYAFDVRSLNKLISKKATNPYNRQKIPGYIIKKVNERLELLKQKKLKPTYDEPLYNYEQKVNMRITEIFQKIDMLEITASGTDVNWFKNLTFPKLKKYYFKLEDIWNYRAQISPEQKYLIVPNNNVFKYNMNYIQNLYNGGMNILKTIVLDEINKLVSSSTSEEHRKMGAYFVLTALTEVSPECASSIPWLVQGSF